MAENISVNVAAVEAEIGEIVSAIEEAQGEVNDAYNSLIQAFSESAGEEADALREQQSAESTLVTALAETLNQFADSIRFAAGELENLDQTGAAHMG